MMQHATIDRMMNDPGASDDGPLIAPYVREQLEGLLGGSQADVAGAPERALMHAMLQDAVMCLIGEAAPASDRERLAADARYWVESHSREWVFAFESVCDGLGIDADWARRRLLAMADARRSTATQGCVLRSLRKGGSRRRRAIHYMGGRRNRVGASV
jgi:hypothetical protein